MILDKAKERGNNVTLTFYTNERGGWRYLPAIALSISLIAPETIEPSSVLHRDFNMTGHNIEPATTNSPKF